MYLPKRRIQNPTHKIVLRPRIIFLLLMWTSPCNDGGGRSDCDWILTRPFITKYFFRVIYQGSQIISIQLEGGHQKIRGRNSSSLSSSLSADLTNQAIRGANQRVYDGNPWHSSSKIASSVASRFRLPCVVTLRFLR